MIYRGYALYSTPNDPGVIIRTLPEPHLTTGPIVGSAPSYTEGQAWVDQILIDYPDGPPWGPGGKPKPPQ